MALNFWPTFRETFSFLLYWIKTLSGCYGKLFPAFSFFSLYFLFLRCFTVWDDKNFRSEYPLNFFSNKMHKFYPSSAQQLEKQCSFFYPHTYYSITSNFLSSDLCLFTQEHLHMKLQGFKKYIYIYYCFQLIEILNKTNKQYNFIIKLSIYLSIYLSIINRYNPTNFFIKNHFSFKSQF